MKLGILKSIKNYHLQYAESCRELGVEFEIIDLMRADWIEKIQASDCDGFLTRPPGIYPEWKALYEERVHVIHHLLEKPIYPTWDEIQMYENKRLTSYWLEMNGYPHVRSRVFADRSDALNYLEDNELPLVFKSSFGSAALGVRIVRSISRGRRLINRVFGQFHPVATFGLIPWKRFKGIPLPLPALSQRHTLIIQNYVPIKWEWRLIRIGDSYFGHRKLLKGEYASGSDRVGWVRPPDQLFDLLREICDRHGFWSMNIDVFETEDGRFFINELHSLFGSFLDYQMRLDGKPGRFLWKDGSYQFEEGEFNRHGSNLLRTEHFIRILNSPGPLL